MYDRPGPTTIELLKLQTNQECCKRFFENTSTFVKYIKERMLKWRISTMFTDNRYKILEARISLNQYISIPYRTPFADN